MTEVAVAILFDKTRENILIGKRPSHKPFPHYWEFPGGKVESQETPVEAVIREIAEELSLTIKQPTFLFKKEGNGFRTYFFSSVVDFQLMNNREYSTYSFIKPEDLTSYNFLPHNQFILPLMDREQLLAPTADFLYSHNLLIWYDETKRELPFRLNKNPYYVLLSEFMLQQTGIKTVIPYFNRFIATYPTLEALAAGDETTVLNLWEGLGYYSRGKNLLKTAQQLINNYQGQLPRNLKELQKLPGIGPYTASALLSILYDEKTPALDGNLLRITARLFAINKDISKEKNRPYFREKLLSIMPEKRSGDFNEALMDLGSLICKPKPLCKECPFELLCVANREGSQSNYPIKKAKTATKTLNMEVALIEHQGKVLLEKRPDKGLFAGLYGLPIHEELSTYFKEHYQLKLQLGETLQRATHTFSHRVWKMTLKRGTLSSLNNLPPELLFVPWEKINDYPIPTAFKKLLKK